MGEVSTREAQVLSLAAKGKTDEGIAKELGITVATVRGYWLRIRTKLGGSGRAELVAQWITAGNRHNDLLIEQALQDQISETRSDFEQLLADERDAMDRLLAKASPEERELIQKIRNRSDESLRGSGQDNAAEDSAQMR